MSVDNPKSVADFEQLVERADIFYRLRILYQMVEVVIHAVAEGKFSNIQRAQTRLSRLEIWGSILDYKVILEILAIFSHGIDLERLRVEGGNSILYLRRCLPMLVVILIYQIMQLEICLFSEWILRNLAFNMKGNYSHGPLLVPISILLVQLSPSGSAG